MNLYAFIFLLFGLQALCLWVGKKSSNDLNSQDDYFLAGKNIGFFPLMMTFLATQVGGGLVLGAAEEAYLYGWSVLFYPLGASLGLIALGLGIGRKLASYQVATIAQLFEKIYGSKGLKKLASALSILSLFMILVAQLIASQKFLVSLGLDSKWWLIAFWSIVIFYTSVGGLKAVVATDIVQAIFFIAAFALCFFYVLYTTESSPLAILEAVNNRGDFQASSKLYGWLFMPLLFMIIEQDMAQRCFAAQSPKVVSKATLCAGLITCLIAIIPVFFGILANRLALIIPEGASVLMTTLTAVTSPLLSAMAGCAILAAIISTADSLINAIGSNLSQDFEWTFLEKKNVRTLQIMTALIAVCGLLFSFYFNNIVDILIQSYELSVSCLFIPIAMALLGRQGRKQSAIFAITAGAMGFVLFKMLPLSFIPQELGSVLLSFLGYALGEFLKATQSQTAVEEDRAYES